MVLTVNHLDVLRKVLLLLLMPALLPRTSKEVDSHQCYYCAIDPSNESYGCINQLRLLETSQQHSREHQLRHALFSKKSVSQLGWGTGLAQAQSQPPTSSLSQASLHDLAAFIASFAQHSKVTFVGICDEDFAERESGSGGSYSPAALLLIKRIMLFGVLAGSCQKGSASKSIQGCLKISEWNTSYPINVPYFCQSETRDMRVYLARDRIDQNIMTAVDRVYRGSKGTVTQMILGHNLKARHIEAVAGMWLLASSETSNGVIDVYEVYQFLHSKNFVDHWIATWHWDTDLLYGAMPGVGPSDFRNNVIYMAAFPDPPYYMDSEEQDVGLSRPYKQQFKPSRFVGNVPSATGFLIEVMDSVAELLNFTYAIVRMPPDDQLYGVGAADNYSGMIGALYRQEADIGLGSLTMTKERAEVADYSVSVDYYAKNLYLRANATKEAMAWTTYLQSFHWLTWLSVVFTALISSLVFWIIVRLQPIRQMKEGPRLLEEQEEDPRILSEMVFMHFGCLVQQGYHVTPFSPLLRLVFLVFWSASLCLYASYTATLTSSLTVKVDSLPFSSLQQAASSSQWDVGIVMGTPTIQIIQSINEDWSNALANKISNNPDLEVPNEMSGIRKVHESNFALLTDSISMDYLLAGDCSISSIPMKGSSNHGYLPYRKNLPYSGVLNRQLSLLDAGGILQRMQKAWWGASIPCKEPPAFEELGFTQTVSAFAVLLVGFSLAGVLLFCEVSVSRCSKNRREGRERRIKNYRIQRNRTIVWPSRLRIAATEITASTTDNVSPNSIDSTETVGNQFDITYDACSQMEWRPTDQCRLSSPDI